MQPSAAKSGGLSLSLSLSLSLFLFYFVTDKRKTCLPFLELEMREKQKKIRSIILKIREGVLSINLKLRKKRLSPPIWSEGEKNGSFQPTKMPNEEPKRPLNSFFYVRGEKRMTKGSIKVTPMQRMASSDRNVFFTLMVGASWQSED